MSKHKENVDVELKEMNARLHIMSRIITKIDIIYGLGNKHQENLVEGLEAFKDQMSTLQSQFEKVDVLLGEDLNYFWERIRNCYEREGKIQAIQKYRFFRPQLTLIYIKERIEKRALKNNWARPKSKK